MQFGVTEIQVPSVSKQYIMQGLDHKHHMAIRSIFLWFRSALLMVTTYYALAQNMGELSASNLVSFQTMLNWKSYSSH